MIDKIKEKITIPDAIIITIGIILSISTFAVNYANLPKGFELAKVNFMNISNLILIWILITYVASRFILNKKVGIGKGISVLVILLISFVAATLFSEFQKIALYGNSYRDQGLIFYALIAIAAFTTYYFVNRRNYILIPISIFLSSIVQALMASSQFVNLLNKKPELLDDGLWINGAYGQANFFSTHIILGIFCAIYLWKKLIPMHRDKLKIITKVFIATACILLILILAASFSQWGWVTAVVGIIAILMFEFLDSKKFSISIIIYLILLLLLSPFVYLSFKAEGNMRILIWEESMKIWINQLFTNPQHFLFGFGFDTLSEVFKKNELTYLAGADRGHNIFVDVIVQIGLMGITIFVFLLGLIVKNAKKIIKDRDLFYAAFFVMIFILKTIIHEYSAANIFQFMILLAGCLKILNEEVIRSK